MKTELFTIRKAETSDLPEIYNLIQTAFETAKVKDSDEQDFAVRLRDGENYIAQLELVAERDGKLIGHIMLTHTYVEKPDGERFDTLLVAPLSVLVEYRGIGVGGALMAQGLKLAGEMGFSSAFLCGDPAYYSRLGFTLTHMRDIRHDSIPDDYVMCYEICKGALDDVKGMIKM